MLDVGIVTVIVSLLIQVRYNICEKCYVSNGHALGFYDHKEYDRFHFRKKSIYRSEEVSL